MHAQPRPFTLQLFLDFRTIFFPEWPLIFLVIKIHQVIWPSPSTLVAAAVPTAAATVVNILEFRGYVNIFESILCKYPRVLSVCVCIVQLAAG